MTPSDKSAEEDATLSKERLTFPQLELPLNVEIWLRAAYERMRTGKPIEPQQMLVQLWHLLGDFDYRSIDRRLMQHGVHPTLVGILKIDPNTELFEQTELVIRSIKEKIKEQPTIEHVTAGEVSQTVGIPESRVAVIFLLMSHLGQFFYSASGTGPGYTSLTIREENVKREYLRFESLEPLLLRLAKGNHQSMNTSPKTEFVHTLLDSKLHERLDDAMRWVDGLPADEIKTLHTDTRSMVERFAITVPVLASEPVRDERMPELEDLALDRKTGATGHIFMLEIYQGAEWFQEIKSQKVTSDSYPLAFLKNENWIHIKLTLSPSDPAGTLKRKLDERLVLVREYCAYIQERIVQFNNGLRDEMRERFKSRNDAIRKGETETEALGLAKRHNPPEQIEGLMQHFRDRLPIPKEGSKTAGDDGNNKRKEESSDLRENALIAARYLYSNNFIGSRGIKVRDLRKRLNLSDGEFELVDEYLLQANYSEGTMGGDEGERSLTVKGVDFATLNTVETSISLAKDSKITSIDIFISHSSQDKEIVKALVRLFRAALSISADRIRCTSLDGHRLPAGADIDDHLRLEVRESRVFLAVISNASVKSTYVLFELGARWGAKLPLLPLLVKSTDKELLAGPLSTLNAVTCDSRPQVHQLIDDVASQLDVPVGKAATYQDEVDAVLSIATS